MSREEKLLLLELLMRDMRGAFPYGSKDPRIIKVLELTKELELKELHDGTVEWLKNTDYYDGRFFRDCDMNYEEIAKMHNLPKTYKDKSLEFIVSAEIIEYKEFMFLDCKSNFDYMKHIEKLKGDNK